MSASEARRAFDGGRVSDTGDTPVFDIGGTWFRTGLLRAGGTLTDVTRVPALSFRNRPDLDAPALQAALVRHLVEEVRRLCGPPVAGRARHAGISMGAALDGRNGFVWNSGPLWGPTSRPFDLGAALAAADPGTRWVVVNDITAALLWHVARDTAGEGRTTLVTVSTGIGCRTWDARRRLIPLDPVCGLQGEIGHLPVAFRLGARLLDRDCDCGGPNHLNAFCSGVGIAALLPLLAREFAGDYAASPRASAAGEAPGLRELGESAGAGEPFARRALAAFTRPLAEMLLHLFTLDPENERVLVTGGVVHGLAPHYLDALLDQLEGIGLYQVSAREPEFFRRRLQAGQADDQAGLLGAGLAAGLEARA